MSIKRYGFYRYGFYRDGGSAPARFRELDNGDYVKYDDHIAKINEKCRRTAIVTEESWNKQVEMLKAEVETTEQLKMMYKNELFEAEARIDELEPDSKQWKQRYLDLKDLNDENFGNIKKWKAEGIRERFHAIKNLMNGKGSDPFREGYLYALELFIEYADKLEKGE